jgi:hypothetical protein
MIESLLGLQVAVLNEECQEFTQNIGNFSSVNNNKSILQLGRIISNHQQNIMQIIDNQLLSSLMALKSKKASLLLKRRLLKERIAYKDSSKMVDNQSKAHLTKSLIHSLDRTIAITNMITPFWSHINKALQYLLSGHSNSITTGANGIKAKLKFPDSAVLSNHTMLQNEVYNISILPSFGTNNLPDSRPCIPWLLKCNDLLFYLLDIVPRQADNVLEALCFPCKSPNSLVNEPSLDKNTVGDESDVVLDAFKDSSSSLFVRSISSDSYNVNESFLSAVVAPVDNPNNQFRLLINVIPESRDSEKLGAEPFSAGTADEINYLIETILPSVLCLPAWKNIRCI